MTVTATRAQGASKQSTGTHQYPIYEDRIITLTPTQAKVVDAWSAARQARLDAEKLEKRYKTQIQAWLPEVPVGQRIKLRVRSVVRVVVSWRPRSGTDRDLLLQGFPEAYEATATHVDYQQIDPA